MQQIYRRTPGPSAMSIKLLCNFIEITLCHGCSLVNLLHIFRTPPKNTSGLLLYPATSLKEEIPSQVFPDQFCGVLKTPFLLNTPVQVFLFCGKKLLPFTKSVPSNFSLCKVSWKNKKYLDLGQKMLYLEFFGLAFEKVIVIWEISTLGFLSEKRLVQNENP